MVRAVEVSQRHPVDLFGDVLAESIADIHGHARHDPTLNIGEHRRQQVQAKRHENDVADVAKVDGTRSGKLVHHALEQLGGGLTQNLGANDGKHGGGGGENQHDEDRQPVRAQVLDQLRHRALEVARFGPFHQVAHWAVAHAASADRATPGRSVRTFVSNDDHANSSMLSCESAISR